MCLQEDLLRAPNTIDAYARGVNDWLAFCHSVALTAAVAGRDTVALYVRSLHTGRQLAATTIHHRLTVVRLYCDWLCEEGMREKNPVRRGSGKAAEGEYRASCRCSGRCRGYLMMKTGCVF